MKRRARALICCLVLFLSALPALESSAAPGSSGKAAETRQLVNPSSSVGATSGKSSLSRLAEALTHLPFPEASVVVFAPIREQQEAGLSEKARASLHAQLVQVVGSSVPLARKRLSEPMGLGDARTEARRRHLALVYIVPEVVAGSLVLDVTFTQWPTSFWQRTLLPEGTTTLHESVQVPADELIRRLLPPPPGLLTETKKFKNPIQSPVALACGDINGDGGQELLIVGRREIALGRFNDDSFITESTSSWDDLSPIAASPLRAPLGAAAMDESGALIGLSDRAQMVKLDARLKLLSQVPQAYPLTMSDCLQFAPTGLSENRFLCELPAKQRPTVAGAFDAVATGQVTEPSGIVAQVTTLLPVGSAAITRIESGAHSGTELILGNLGDAFALSDLDGDGSLELLSSQEKSSNSSDSLHVHSIKNGRLDPIFDLPTGPIHALTVCPFSGRNPQLVTLAVGNELWVLK